MRPRRAGLPVLGAVLVVLVAGCGAGRAATAAPTSARPVTTPAARLDPCPAATGARTRLPDLTLPCLAGGPAVSLRRLGGRPLVLNVWASWCGPCYAEMPALQRLHATARGRLTVLGVDNADTSTGALRATVDTGVRYPSVSDPGRRLVTALSRNVMPTTVFVRADGTVAHILSGPVTGDAQLRALVRRYLRVSV